MGRYVLSRAALTLAAIALALGASGCLRQNFDLCAGDMPHEDCALVDAAVDAGPDAGADASTADAAADAGR